MLNLKLKDIKLIFISILLSVLVYNIWGKIKTMVMQNFILIFIKELKHNNLLHIDY